MVNCPGSVETRGRAVLDGLETIRFTADRRFYGEG